MFYFRALFTLASDDVAAWLALSPALLFFSRFVVAARLALGTKLPISQADWSILYFYFLSRNLIGLCQTYALVSWTATV